MPEQNHHFQLPLYMLEYLIFSTRLAMLTHIGTISFI